MEKDKLTPTTPKTINDIVAPSPKESPKTQQKATNEKQKEVPSTGLNQPFSSSRPPFIAISLAVAVCICLILLAFYSQVIKP